MTSILIVKIEPNIFSDLHIDLRLNNSGYLLSYNYKCWLTTFLTLL